jgi:site-specific recombinase XerD
MIITTWQHFTRAICDRPFAADIANALSYLGRRSGLTTLVDKGVGVRGLMALAGQSQIATTQRYIDLRPSVVRSSVELV